MGSNKETCSFSFSFECIFPNFIIDNWEGWHVYLIATDNRYDLFRWINGMTRWQSIKSNGLYELFMRKLNSVVVCYWVTLLLCPSLYFQFNLWHSIYKFSILEFFNLSTFETSKKSAPRKFLKFLSSSCASFHSRSTLWLQQFILLTTKYTVLINRLITILLLKAIVLGWRLEVETDKCRQITTWTLNFAIYHRDYAGGRTSQLYSAHSPIRVVIEVVVRSWGKTYFQEFPYQQFLSLSITV